jgi:hypothetical protein
MSPCATIPPRVSAEIRDQDTLNTPRTLFGTVASLYPRRYPDVDDPAALVYNDTRLTYR